MLRMQSYYAAVCYATLLCIEAKLLLVVEETMHAYDARLAVRNILHSRIQSIARSKMKLQEIVKVFGFPFIVM